MKRVLSAVLTMAMLCGLLSVSAMAAVSDYPEEFREGKTKQAYSDPLAGVFFALQEDGSLWGIGDIEILGITTNVPKKLAENVASFWAQSTYIAILKTDGSLWDAELFYMNGVAKATGFVKKLEHVTEVSIPRFGANFTLAVQENGSLWAWGNDTSGQLGIGDKIPNPSAYDAYDKYSTNQPIKIMDDVAHVSAGEWHSLALKRDGSVWAWGTNNYGQVGTGSLPGPGEDGIGVGPSLERTPIHVMNDVKSIYATYSCSIAIKNDGSLWYWGRLPYESLNTLGQPTPVKLAEDVQEVFSGHYETEPLLFLKNDNSLWCCGGEPSNYFSPPDPFWPPQALEKIADDVASAAGPLIQKTDGTVWAMGENTRGNLCDGGVFTVNPQVPHKGVLESVAFLSEGVAIQESGALWVFGDNTTMHNEKFFPAVEGEQSMVTPVQLTGPVAAPPKDTTVPPPTPAAFTDVAATSPYSAAVAWAVAENITAGTTATTFAPNATCTNAQILTFLWRAKGQPEPTVSNPFADVQESDYFYKAALWAYERRIVPGTKLDPAAPCTRIQTVEYLWKFEREAIPSGGMPDFTDIDPNVHNVQALTWAVEQGITTGTSATTFAPDATCTRGQIVTFLYRDLVK